MINVLFNDSDYQLLPKQREVFYKYNQVLQWARANPVLFLREFLNIELTDMQKYVFLNTWNSQLAVLVMGRSSGKALDLNTRVYLKNKKGEPHYCTVGDLRVGDKIYDSQGKLSEVIHLNPIIYNDYYIVEFDDGEKINCNGEHLWLAHDRNFHKKEQDLNKFRLLNTDYIYNNFNRGKNYSTGENDYTFHVPLNKPIKYSGESQYLPIDPYVLGYWLGDGCVTSGVITCSHDDVEEAVKNLSKCCTTIRYRKDVNKDNCDLILVDFERDLKEKGVKSYKEKSLKSKLRNLENLLNDKHIPERYLYNTVENRLALLQGLLDTDGTIDKNGKCEFTQTNKQMAEDVAWLIRSLGMKATVTHKIHTGYIKKNGEEADTWRIYFAPSKELPVFRMKRKYDRLKDHPTRGSDRKAIVNVTKVDSPIYMRCITMRNDDGTFLCGDKFTVTHNSFLSAPYIMCRTLLFPNHHTYIMAPSGGQSSGATCFLVKS